MMIVDVDEIDHNFSLVPSHLHCKGTCLRRPSEDPSLFLYSGSEWRSCLSIGLLIFCLFVRVMLCEREPISGMLVCVAKTL